MKVNLNTPIYLHDGITELKDNNKVVTMKDVCITSLLQPLQEDDQKSKWDKYSLYKKLKDFTEGILSLSTEEIMLIKTASGKVQPTLVMGQIFDNLEKE